MLTVTIPPLPSAPRGILPPPMEEFIWKFSNDLRADHTAGIVAALTVAGVMLARRRVMIRAVPGVTEPPVLWTAVIGPAGVGKSAMIEAVAEPAYREELEIEKENRERWREYEIAMEDRKLSRRLGPAIPPTKPVPRQLLLTVSPTPTRFEKLLIRNVAVLLLQDEMWCLFSQWRSSRPPVSLLTAAYHGFLFERPSDEEPPQRGTLGILGTFRPDGWCSAVQRLREKQSEADLLLCRFVPVFMWHRDEARSEELLKDSHESYVSALQEAVKSTPEGFVLELSEEARDLWRRIEEEWKPSLSLSDFWRAFSSKRLGILARVAGIMAALWGEKEITAERLSKAAKLLRVLDLHAAYAWSFEETGDDPLRLARHLRENGIQKFKLRDVYFHKWAGIRKMAQAEEACEALARVGLIRLKERRKVGRGHEVIFEVTPELRTAQISSLLATPLLRRP